MSTKDKIIGSVEAWESGLLGEDEKHMRSVSQELDAQIDESIGLQMISIRLDKSLIDSFKLLGEFHGIGYQPLMRDALKRFAECEMKAIVSGVVGSQRKDQAGKQPVSRKSSSKEKEAA